MAKRLRLTAEEFIELPEYSASIPTGTTPGKRWRRLDGAHDQGFMGAGGKPKWLVGEYQEIPGDDKNVRINWYKPIITVRASTDG